MHEADGGGRAGPVRPGQAVDQDGAALGEGRLDELQHRPEEVGQFLGGRCGILLILGGNPAHHVTPRDLDRKTYRGEREKSEESEIICK